MRSMRSSTRGGTLIAAGSRRASRSISAGAHRSTRRSPAGVTAQQPLVEAKIVRTDNPMFYGYDRTMFPMKFGRGSPCSASASPIRATCSREYVGGDASVLSGLMVGADSASRAFAVDVPGVRRSRASGALRQQSDLSLAEPWRVQHGLQRDGELG